MVLGLLLVVLASDPEPSVPYGSPAGNSGSEAVARTNEQAAVTRIGLNGALMAAASVGSAANALIAWFEMAGSLGPILWAGNPQRPSLFLIPSLEAAASASISGQVRFAGGVISSIGVGQERQGSPGQLGVGFSLLGGPRVAFDPADRQTLMGWRLALHFQGPPSWSDGGPRFNPGLVNIPGAVGFVAWAFLLPILLLSPFLNTFEIGLEAFYPHSGPEVMASLRFGIGF